MSFDNEQFCPSAQRDRAEIAQVTALEISNVSAAEQRGNPPGPAEVIPTEKNQRHAQAECPDCGWQGKPRTEWSRAQEDANRHNLAEHAPSNWPGQEQP